MKIFNLNTLQCLLPDSYWLEGLATVNNPKFYLISTPMLISFWQAIQTINRFQKLKKSYIFHLSIRTIHRLDSVSSKFQNLQLSYTFFFGRKVVHLILMPNYIEFYYKNSKDYNKL